MPSITRKPLPLLLILLGVFACAIPGTPQVDQNAAGTAVQETLSAILKQTEDAGQSIVDVTSDTPAPSATASPTFTAIPASFTPTLVPTSTLTPTLVPSATPTLPMISVSVATNCRIGPGTVYQILGYLPKGEWVRVYAQDSSRGYWYIRNPSNASQFCWVWGEYATFIGSMTGLPVYTPPPSPTPTMTSTPAPDFHMSYASLQTCAGKWWVNLKLKNTGTVTFRSIEMTVTNVGNPLVKTSTSNDFTVKIGCNAPSTNDTLIPGKTLAVSAPPFGYKLVNKINAAIQLCTQADRNGFCVTQTISFKP